MKNARKGTNSRDKYPQKFSKLEKQQQKVFLQEKMNRA